MANQLDLGLRALDANGYIIAGAKALVYLTGTSTLIDVWTDADGSIAAANPIIADGNGYWPQRFVSQTARVVITDADDVTLQTLDPAPTSIGTGSAASDVAFAPTVEVPFTNVQDAIQGTALTVLSGVSAYGIGITGNAPLLANIDATNTAAGIYRFDGATTGTYPTGVVAADLGMIEQWRQSATVGAMELHHATTNRVFRRRLTAGAWGAWRERIEVNIGATRGDIIRRGASDWERLAIGANSTTLVSDGTDAAWSDLTALVTSLVGPATAGLAVGAVGTYAMLRPFTGITSAAGSTHAGSGLRYTNAEGRVSGTPSGTWRLMGAIENTTPVSEYVSLFLRIS